MPGADGVVTALWAVRMNRDALAVLFGGVDGRLHLVVRERLIACDVGAAPGRAVHLDVVRACVDLLLHRFGNLRDVVYASPERVRRVRSRAERWTRLLQPVAGDVHVWPGNTPRLTESRRAMST